VNRVRVLFLDYGGAFAFSYNPESWAKIVERHVGVNPDTVAKRHLTDLVATGAITMRMYVDRLQAGRHTDHACDMVTLCQDLLAATPHPSGAMIEAVRNLRSHHRCRVALVSDIATFERGVVVRRAEPAGFDGLYLSCDRGVSKAKGRLFRVAMDELEVDPKSTVVVDDRDYALRGAAMAGINAQIRASSFDSERGLIDEIYRIAT
jgi:FMN phosphatase YigB (HAD superfamily)